MKSRFIILRGRSVSDTVGLFAVLGLLVVNAFHYNINPTFPFYRELFGVLFVILSGRYLFTSTQALESNTSQMNRPLFYLLLFPALLFVWSFIDPGVPLYGGYMLELVSNQLGGTPLSLYVLRNALLYLPMVVYLYLRGLNLKEIRLIALTAIMVAPLSVGAFLQHGELTTLAKLGVVAELGGFGVAYNSYVPYLNFLVLCGIYLLFSSSNYYFKWIALINVVIVSIYCLLTTSRSSVMFIGISFLAFFFLSREGKSPRIKWINLTAFVILAMVLFSYFTQGYVFSPIFLDRYADVAGFFGTTRLDTAIHGLNKLDPIEWLTGAGLTCVVFSGPHNDYIRWTQRVGVFLMLFGFSPFFITFAQSIKLALRNRNDNTLYIFLALAIFYTLFQSGFGYPREEANQAVAVYFGLALWFGAYRNGLLSLTYRTMGH